MNRGLWPIIVGFGVWVVAFNGLYAAHALGCFWHWPEPVHRLVLVALYLTTLGTLAAMLAAQRHSTGALRRMGVILLVCAFLASVVIFSPTAFLSYCT